MTDRATARNIDEYIAACSPEVQLILEKIRLTIRKVTPKAEEKISYRIPTFTLDGRYLIYRAMQFTLVTKNGRKMIKNANKNEMHVLNVSYLSILYTCYKSELHSPIDLFCRF